jgi:RNase adapter protein RapZ
MTARPLELTIITGLSGAGRSSAADVLEDLGFFVIDNLPPALIPKVAELARDRERDSRFALVVDVRSGSFMDELDAALREVRAAGVRTSTLFLDASDEALVRRFEASRRPHPRAAGSRVSDGIAEERSLLEELKGEADVVVDTSNLNVHELRDRLHELFRDESAAGSLQTTIVSFGYKHGVPLDVDLVFDCRFLPNPHWVDALRPLPGTDERVRRYVLDQPEAAPFLEELRSLFALLLPAFAREGKSYLSIGIGCTGGRHRSVVIAAELATVLAGLGYPARVHHRDLERE